ncbi:MAG TPA: hypothetical protein VHG93_08315 [Longimicrobium sp.]|nr:hypothetical protein [Longimicrobium sp.]
MRMHRWIPTLAVLSALSLGACGGSNADDDQVGGTQGQEAGAGVVSDRDGRSVSGSESAEEHGTAVNDTTPHRPGMP